MSQKTQLGKLWKTDDLTEITLTEKKGTMYNKLLDWGWGAGPMEELFESK